MPFDLRRDWEASGVLDRPVHDRQDPHAQPAVGGASEGGNDDAGPVFAPLRFTRFRFSAPQERLPDDHPAKRCLGSATSGQSEMFSMLYRYSGGISEWSISSISSSDMSSSRITRRSSSFSRSYSAAEVMTTDGFPYWVTITGSASACSRYRPKFFYGSADVTIGMTSSVRKKRCHGRLDETVKAGGLPRLAGGSGVRPVEHRFEQHVAAGGQILGLGVLDLVVADAADGGNPKGRGGGAGRGRFLGGACSKPWVLSRRTMSAGRNGCLILRRKVSA